MPTKIHFPELALAQLFVDLETIYNVFLRLVITADLVRPHLIKRFEIGSVKGSLCLCRGLRRKS